MKKDGLDEKSRARDGGWTSVEHYFVALARRRTARHKREGRYGSGRMDVDGPTPTLGTIPFIVIMAAFALLVVAIASLAWPRHEQARPQQPPAEVGHAAPGWYERAEAEMKRAR